MDTPNNKTEPTPHISHKLIGGGYLSSLRNTSWVEAIHSRYVLVLHKADPTLIIDTPSWPLNPDRSGSLSVEAGVHLGYGPLN